MHISILMSGLKGAYHPNAYLQNTKNIKCGLQARSRILNILDNQTFSAIVIARKISMNYNAVMYHLRLLEKEETVCRKGKRPCIWVSTGLGQKRLIS